MITYVQIGQYVLGSITYTLYRDDSDTPLGLDVGLRVLNHVERRGTTIFNLSSPYKPTDFTLLCLDKDGSLFDVIVSSDERTLKLVITDSETSLRFTGFYVPEIDESSMSISDVTLQLRFYDGMTLLKDKSYGLNGHIIISDFLRTMLDEIGYLLDINVVLDVYQPTLSASLNLNKERISMDALLRKKPDASYFDALIEFCTRFGCWIFQDENAWYIIQYGARDKSWQNIETDGNVRILFEYDIEFSIAGKFLRPSYHKKLRGLTEFNFKEQFTEDELALENSEFQFGANGWTVTGGTTSIHDTFTTDKGRALELNSANMSISQFTNRVSYGKVLFRVKAEVNLDNSSVVNDTLNFLQIRFFNDDQEEIYTIGASVNLDGTGGNVTLDIEDERPRPTFDFFTGFVEVSGISENESYVDTSDGWYIRFYEISVAIDNDYDQPIEDVISISAANNDRGDTESIEVYLSDNEKLTRISDFQYDNGGAWESALDWTSSKHFGNSPFSTIVGENLMRKMGTGLSILKTSLPYSEWVSFRYLITSEFEGESIKLVPFYIQRTAKKEKYKSYLIEYPEDQLLS